MARSQAGRQPPAGKISLPIAASSNDELTFPFRNSLLPPPSLPPRCRSTPSSLPSTRRRWTPPPRCLCPTRRTQTSKRRVNDRERGSRHPPCATMAAMSLLQVFVSLCKVSNYDTTNSGRWTGPRNGRHDYAFAILQIVV